MYTTGMQAKYILETTFTVVANKDVICVTADQLHFKFKAIVHSEIVRARREHLSADNQEGIIDKRSKRMVLLKRDVLAVGLTEIDPTSYFLVDGIRYDFSVSEPFTDDDTTPFADADQVFFVFYLRRAGERESEIPLTDSDDFSFGSWKV